MFLPRGPAPISSGSLIRHRLQPRHAAAFVATIPQVRRLVPTVTELGSPVYRTDDDARRSGERTTRPWRAVDGRGHRGVPVPGAPGDAGPDPAAGRAAHAAGTPGRGGDLSSRQR